MQNILYEYLLLFRQISLPGIGSISIKKETGNYDFGDKQITSPVYSFIFDQGNDQPSKKLFAWLANSLGITEWDAIRSVNDFAYSIKQSISETGQMNWNNVGLFKRNLSDKYHLESSVIYLPGVLEPVKAEKVIRNQSEHTILVGEQERSAMEMEKFYITDEPKRDYSWVIAIVITIVSLMFIGWHFSEKGFKPSSAGNHSILKEK